MKFIFVDNYILVICLNLSKSLNIMLMKLISDIFYDLCSKRYIFYQIIDF